MFLTQEQLLPRLKERLEAADRVDIATAWMSFGGAFSALHAFAKARPNSLRAIVGTDGTTTHPRALRQIQQSAQLRLPATHPLFHPKVLIFHQRDGAVIWVGSANFTRCGFEQNTEVVAELLDESGDARAWFDKTWSELDADCGPRLDQYEATWKPAPGGQGYDPTPPLSEETLWELAKGLTDWPSFVHALKVANPIWQQKMNCTVDGEASSWLNTITLGTEITRRESWDDLSDVDYHVLLGIKDDAEDVMGYGLLGSMQGAGEVKATFLRHTPENRATREHIRSYLQGPIHASDSAFPEAAIEFIRQVSGMKRFGPAVATRLLTLARPDRAVSVNNGSRPGLSQLTGLPRSALSNVPTGSRAKSYADLLAYLETKDWYRHPQPANRYEQTLANARGALLDCLVYVPTGSEVA